MEARSVRDAKSASKGAQHVKSVSMRSSKSAQHVKDVSEAARDAKGASTRSSKEARGSKRGEYLEGVLKSS
ncbi:hypothetical protein PISMIDRAFT_19631 [Pisolithus microcarpus 441]|uniref:Uncharacterized protein n=1 Tax=Pisolithus microcarpus 441 TaxID=765257 RepID=A0A0C9YTU8_9AGAM|nr:hypothetical protein BKA83DRAFT_19631 [Pisolithus microcarpus]KIK11313.1 hypothetical protein PISMIDRAFT_19631 [Pisolithus microcarpus 441]